MSELENKVPGILEDEDDDEVFGTDEAWHVTDDGDAEWCINQIREAEAIVRKWEQHYKQQLEKVKAVQGRRIERFRGYLREYLTGLSADGLAKETKTTTSYKLPSGTLTLKHGAIEYVKDEDKLLAWLQETGRGEYIKTEVSPKWGELKKLTVAMPNGDVAIKDTGELVEGVHTEAKPDVFEVK